MTGSPNRSKAAPSPKPPPSTDSATSKASWTPSPTRSSPPSTTASWASSTRPTWPSPGRCWAGTPTPSSSPRSPVPAQRSADALRVMAQRSTTLAGGAVAAAAEIVIHMTQDQYEAGVARDLGDPEATADPDGFCELDDGTVISPIAAVYLASIANFRRIVYGPGDEIINYSRARRGYSPPQYGALRAKYRRCAHPWGCGRTGRALQADHIQEHSDGGPTDSPTANASAASTTAGRPDTNTTHPAPPPKTPAPAEPDPPTSADPRASPGHACHPVPRGDGCRTVARTLSSRVRRG